ncbi:MAG: hypothetical protein MR711_12080 [Selenomonas sp.]|uniref:hypothetical protein n=1 Tax=Selenomonas sp. TaxID=2053611 RepID=UPI0025F56208|nr:hypothetical protein [Selenomonas sp.]MCI6086956.1 hypothetical protein [Selenomonas sp.]
MKTHVFRFLSLTILFLALGAGYNYWNDTPGIFHRDYNVPRPSMNRHFVKVRYLIEHPDKYDAYCFGSSRVGQISFENLANGHSYYNMTYSMGLPEDFRKDLELMLRHHVTVRQILIGLDEFSFRLDPAIVDADYYKIPYQENNLRTYIAYLFRTPSKPYRWESGQIYDIENTGRVLLGNRDEAIERNPEEHRKKVATDLVDIRPGNRIPETLEAMRQIKNICDENNIELIVFINPIEHRTYEATNLDEFNDFKQGLAKIMPYYDFSGLNRITTDDYYYYEPSHYRPIVGDMIIHRIFDMPKDAETDFGKYVEQAN